MRTGDNRHPSASASKVTERIHPKKGRTRKRRPYSAANAPLPARVSRKGKASRGRTPTTQVPAYIRAEGLTLDREDRAYLRRKLGAKLGPFVQSIERVSVRVEDVNGPRGGKDKACRVKVVLSGLPSVVVEKRDADLQFAMDGALAQAERAVRKAVGRRRTTSRRDIPSAAA